MKQDFYFIFDNFDEEISLRKICCHASDAIKALENCWIDDKHNDSSVHEISFCLIFSQDFDSGNYELNRRATDLFIRDLHLCSQCNRVRSNLNKEGTCSECENEFVGSDLFRCPVCKKRRLVHDEFGREMFGTLNHDGDAIIICHKCALDVFNPNNDFKKGDE